MLSTMRNKKFNSLILWIVIFAFLATIVVVWGLGEKQTDLTYIAKVDDYVITRTEYSNAYEQTLSQMRQIFGNSADELIRNDDKFGTNVLNTIINNHILLKEAERIKLPVSNAEVVQAIINSPMFTVNGEFDLEQYQTILQYYRMTPEMYENQLKNDLTVSKMRQLTDSSVAVTEEEILREFAFQNTAVSASYFTVTNESFANAMEPEEEELSAYFTENIEQFRQPARIRLKYIMFNANDFDYDFSPTDDELMSRYNAAIGQYTTPETIELSQIIVYVNDWNDPQNLNDIESRLNGALEEINNGLSFAEAARKYSDMAGPEENGYVGTIMRPTGQLTGIDAYIFTLEDGEISDVYRSEFGYHIFKVESRQDAVVIPFEDIKEALAESLYTEAKASAFRSGLYSTYRDIMNAGNITAYQQRNPDAFQVAETDEITQGSTFFAGDRELEDLLFSLGKTEITPPMDNNGTVYIYELVDRQNSYLPQLDDVRNQVIAEYHRTSSFSAARSAVNETLTALTMTASEFAEAARRFGATVENLPTFTRLSPMREDALLNDLPQELFKLNENDILITPVPEQQRIYIVRVNEVTPPNEADLAVTRDAIESYLLSVKQEDALRGYLEQLRKRYKVEINPNFTGGRA